MRTVAILVLFALAAIAFAQTPALPPACAALTQQQQLQLLNLCRIPPQNCTQQYPRPSGDNVCCPYKLTCNLVGCTEQMMKDGITAAPNCQDQAVPMRIPGSCAPTCWIRPVCPIKPENLPVCPPNVQPQFDPATACFSCRPPVNVNPCTAAQLQACEAGWSTLPLCPPGTNPTRAVDATTGVPGCCVDCRIPPPPVCNADAQLRCRNMYDGLPTCAQGTQPQFNQTNCCVNCKLPPPPPVQQPNAQGQCTVAGLQGCFQNLTVVCRPGEIPVRPADRCCPSCVRPQRLCNPADVVACRRSTPTCAAGQKPQPVDNDPRCCMSCIYPRPVCTPACADNQVCLRANGTDTTVCRPKRLIRRIIRVVDATIAAALNGASADDIRDFLSEVVSRWCDQNQNVQDCGRFLTALSNLRVTSTPCADGSANCFDIQISWPDVPDDNAANNPNPNPGLNSVGQIMMKNRFNQLAATVEAAIDASLSNGDSSQGMSSETPSSGNSASFLAPSAIIVVLSVLINKLF